MKMIKRLTALVLITAAAIAATFVIGMRTKSPPVLNAVRSMNRRVFNPKQMETAGSPGASASVIRHTGRRSGTTYETPIVAIDGGEDFVIVLPYGTQADWFRNVTASGSAEIVHEGEAWELVDPRVVSVQSADEVFTDADRRTHSLFNVTEALRLHKARLVG
ncbi:MAG: nitroreductase family deazaflavin-dependent oxidoreductase [Actinomycetia bacterium]|nr:nitroreductase family deazaflavin-dependent oxidoreductase [Actinomycetes bacterium]